jgi:hypothetical protein
MRRSIPVRVGDVDLLVEAEPVAGTEPTSRIDSAVDRVGEAYARAQEAIVEIASSTAESIRKAAARAARPDEVEIEFGLRFSVQGDVIVASAAGEATLRVRLTYQPGIAPTGGDSGTSAGADTGADGEPRLSGPSWESPRIHGFRGSSAGCSARPESRSAPVSRSSLECW